MATEAAAENAAPVATKTDSSALTRHQIRGSSLFLAGNVLSLLITFLPHLLLVRYLSTDGFAHLAYALSLVAIGKTYALGSNEAMSRFVPIYHVQKERGKVLGAIVVVFAITLLISGVLLSIFATWSGPILALLTKAREPADLLLILMFLVPLETFDLLIMNLFACFGRTREIFWGKSVVSPAARVAVTLFVVLGHADVLTLAYGYLAAEIFTVAVFGALMVRELHRQGLFHGLGRVELPVREIVGFSAPLMTSNVIGLIGNSIPVLLLGYFQPMSTVAYYRVVLPAAALSTMIPSTFVSLYLPFASRMYAKGDTVGINHLFWRTSLWMGVLAAPIFIASTCFAHPITVFLYGARYAASAPILAILAIGYFSNVVCAFNVVTLKVLGKIRFVVILNVVTPIILVLFNLLLIPRFGAIGAAFATTAGLLVQNLLRQCGLWRTAPGFPFFDRRYARFLVLLGGSALALSVVHLLRPEPIYPSLVLSLAVSAWLLWIVKPELNVADVFPEVMHVPLLGRFLT